MGAGFPDLVLVNREVLAQKRDIHCLADGVEVGEGPVEAALFGEDADDGSTAVGVLDRQVRGIGDARQVTLGRAAPLDFGDDLQLVPWRGVAAEGSPGVPRGRGSCGAVLQLSEGHQATAGLQVFPGAGIDVVEDSHC